MYLKILIINFVLNIGLVDLVCSTLNEDEIQICAQGVYDWWPSITEALFKYQGTGDVICVGACQCRGSSCGVKSILKQVSTAFPRKRPSLE